MALEKAAADAQTFGVTASGREIVEMEVPVEVWLQVWRAADAAPAEFE
jgi:hypothetical protein